MKLNFRRWTLPVPGSPTKKYLRGFPPTKNHENRCQGLDAVDPGNCKDVRSNAVNGVRLPVMDEDEPAWLSFVIARYLDEDRMWMNGVGVDMCWMGWPCCLVKSSHDCCRDNGFLCSTPLLLSLLGFFFFAFFMTCQPDSCQLEGHVCSFQNNFARLHPNNNVWKKVPFWWRCRTNLFTKITWLFTIWIEVCHFTAHT